MGKKIHGMSRTNIFSIWQCMLDRCLNKRCHAWKNYGGRGIGVSDDWMVFENFYNDMGEKPDGMSLNRINNNLGYSKSNCEWAERKEQQRNTRSNVYIEFNGEKRCLAEWAEKVGMSSQGLSHRIFKMKLPLNMALITPSKKQRKNENI